MLPGPRFSISASVAFIQQLLPPANRLQVQMIRGCTNEKMMKILRIFALFLLLVTLVPLVPRTPVAHAQGTATVAVDPGNISDFSKVQGTNVTFDVNVTNAPSFNAFQVYVSFDISLLRVAKDSSGNFMVDASGNVLANTGATVQTVAECAGGFGIANVCGQVGVDTVVLVQSILGGSSTISPTSGKLFQITFNVVGVGLSQLHLYNVALDNAGAAIATTTADGYFTNIDCPVGSGIFCVPPVSSFTVVTTTPFVNVPLVFNASSSMTFNSGARISAYTWQWGDFLFGGSTLPVVTRVPITTHAYDTAGTYTITLTVNDTFGIKSTTEHIVTVRNPPPQPDFAIDVTSPTLTFDVTAGRALNATVMLASIDGLHGSIGLAVSVANPCCTPPFASLSASLGSSLVKVSSGGANSTTLFLSAPRNSIQGTKYVTVTGTFGPTIHSKTITVLVFPAPPSPPTLVEMHWRPVVGISEHGIGSGTQVFLAGVFNPNNSSVVYASVIITLVDTSTKEQFSIVTAPIAVAARDKVLNIQLETTFRESDIGKSFTFVAILRWGISQDSLSMTTLNATVENSGSFSVGPP